MARLVLKKRNKTDVWHDFLVDEFDIFGEVFRKILQEYGSLDIDFFKNCNVKKRIAFQKKFARMRVCFVSEFGNDADLAEIYEGYFRWVLEADSWKTDRFSRFLDLWKLVDVKLFGDYMLTAKVKGKGISKDRKVDVRYNSSSEWQLYSEFIQFLKKSAQFPKDDTPKKFREWVKSRGVKK